MKGRRIRAQPKRAALPAALPTYQELADIVSELTVANIANLDGEGRFVSCFTYGAGDIPPHWQRAIETREALIEHRVVERRGRGSAS